MNQNQYNQEQLGYILQQQTQGSQVMNNQNIAIVRANVAKFIYDWNTIGPQPDYGLRNIFKIISIILNLAVAILLYKRYQIYMALQQWKNEVDHAQNLKNYKFFYRMVFEMLIAQITLPPTLDLTFSYQYEGNTANYRLDQFISVLALFRTSYLFVRACVKVSIFNDSKAYEICMDVQCSSDQNTFTSKAENKDKHFYLLLPAIFILILVLSYGLRECEIFTTIAPSSVNWNNYAYPVWVEAATLTTVGYGDAVPSTFFGRIFVIVCCLLGPAIISFSIISLVNFSKFTNSESQVFEAVQIGQKQQQLIELASSVTLFSRRHHKHKHQNQFYYNNLKESFMKLKLLKKYRQYISNAREIAHQKKYPPKENLITQFCSSAVNVVQNIQHSTEHFSIYIAIISKIETLQDQINVKVEKLIKDMRDKELELQKGLEKNSFLNGSDPYTETIRGVNLNDLKIGIQSEMNAQQYQQFLLQLQEVSQTKQIQQKGKMKIIKKTQQIDSKQGKELGQNLIKYKVDKNPQFNDILSPRIDRKSITTLDNSLMKYSPAMKFKNSKKEIEDNGQIKQVTFLVKHNEGGEPNRRTNLNLDVLNKFDFNSIISSSLQQYDTIQLYLMRYLAVKKILTEAKTIDQPYKSKIDRFIQDENFLFKQLEIVSNLGVFEQDYIFKFADFQNPTIKKFLISEIRSNNLLVSSAMSDDIFALYFKNNNFEMFKSDNTRATVQLKQSEFV